LGDVNAHEVHLAFEHIVERVRLLAPTKTSLALEIVPAEPVFV
jgi:hypothetical protein